MISACSPSPPTPYSESSTPPTRNARSRISSNIYPSGFDELMPKTLATATVDRLLHHAHVITEGQDTYWLYLEMLCGATARMCHEAQIWCAALRGHRARSYTSYSIHAALDGDWHRVPRTARSSRAGDHYRRICWGPLLRALENVDDRGVPNESTFRTLTLTPEGGLAASAQEVSDSSSDEPRVDSQAIGHNPAASWSKLRTNTRIVQ
jgi:hypothetical protein